MGFQFTQRFREAAPDRHHKPWGDKATGDGGAHFGVRSSGQKPLCPLLPLRRADLPRQSSSFSAPQPGFEVSFFLFFFLFFFFLFLSSLLFSYFFSSSFLLSFFFLLFVGFVRAERVPHCEPGAVQRSRAPLIAELAPGHRTATAPSAAPRSAAGVGRQRENGAAEPGDGSGL